VHRQYTSDFASTTTAAATTTLTVTSAQQQYFTGTTTQTVTLPVATTLANGFHFKIANLSTGAVTVQTSGGNTVATLASATAPASTWGLFTCINTAGGTGTASWSYDQGA
jgi:invasion protein IalB